MFAHNQNWLSSYLVENKGQLTWHPNCYMKCMDTKEILYGTMNGEGVYIGIDKRGKYRAYVMVDPDRMPNFAFRASVRRAVRDYDDNVVMGRTREEVEAQLATLRYVLPLTKQA
jgi:hypothetical protein